MTNDERFAASLPQLAPGTVVSVLAAGRIGDVLPPRPHQGAHIALVAMRPGSPGHRFDPTTFLRSSCCPALPLIQARLRVQVTDAA